MQPQADKTNQTEHNIQKAQQLNYNYIKKRSRFKTAAPASGNENTSFILILLGLNLYSVNCSKKSIFKCVTCL